MEKIGMMVGIQRRNMMQIKEHKSLKSSINLLMVKFKKNGLKNLFYNTENSQDKIIETIDKWWNLYERSNHNKGDK